MKKKYFNKNILNKSKYKKLKASKKKEYLVQSEWPHLN